MGEPVRWAPAYRQTPLTLDSDTNGVIRRSNIKFWMRKVRIVHRHLDYRLAMFLSWLLQLLETSSGTVWKEPNSRDESVNTVSLLKVHRQGLLTLDVRM